MISKLDAIKRALKSLPLNKQDEVYRHIQSIISANDRDIAACPFCGVMDDYVKYGHKDGKQRYKCKSCLKIFTERTGTALAYSQSTNAEWETVIIHTLQGKVLRETSELLDIPIERIWRMRHIIMRLIEDYVEKSDSKLLGDVEVDDTYFQLSVKGTKNIDEETYGRPARLHGAKSRTRGVSNELASVNVGIARNGDSYSRSVNTGKPSYNDVMTVFSHRINGDADVYCDGDKSFMKAFNKIATVHRVEKFSKTAHMSTVNNFHSQLKQQIERVYKGVATKYLNRYCAMLALGYRQTNNMDEVIDLVHGLLFEPRHNRVKAAQLKTHNILDLGQLANL